MTKYGSLLLTGAALAGCATTPDVSYNYYLPKSATTVSVKQTVKCTSAGELTMTYETPTVTTAYFADTSKAYPIPVKTLDSAISDNSFLLKRTSDGRLQSIDATWTGQGQAIVGSVMTLAKAVAAAGGGAPPGVCDKIAKWGGDAKAVTFVYSGTLDLATDTTANLGARRDVTSTAIFNSINQPGGPQPLPTLTIERTSLSPADIAVSYNGAKSDYRVWLTLRKTHQADFDVKEGGHTLYSGAVVVPGTENYDIPLAGAVAFGANKFGITLDDSGAVTAVDYNKDSGVSAALNSAGTVVTTVAPAPSSPPPQ